MTMESVRIWGHGLWRTERVVQRAGGDAMMSYVCVRGLAGRTVILIVKIVWTLT
jgi:hypothetical protein